MTRRRVPIAAEVKHPPGPVVVRRADWTITQARDLLRQGYTVEHVAAVTGYSARALANGKGKP